MQHELTRGVRGVDSRGDSTCHHGTPTSAAAQAASLTALSLEPSAWAYWGSGYPGGGRSHQGLVISSLTTSPRRWTVLFFGGSGSGSSRGAFPFSSAENRRIGAIGVKTGGGAGKKKQAEKEEMADEGSHPSSFIA